MALHPGSLSAAYAALQVHGWPASTMRRACERAAYSGSFTQGRVTVTFDREAGYRVTARPLPELPAEPADILITHVTEARTTEYAQAIARQYKPTVVRQAADQLHIDPEGHGVAWLRRAIVAEARAGVPERTITASCPSPAHADELADFGDCSECGMFAAQDRKPKRADVVRTARQLAARRDHGQLPQQQPARASAAETPGTIASACAFGWS